MKKFLLMLVIATMAFTTGFAQDRHDDHSRTRKTYHQKHHRRHHHMDQHQN
jgi:hypothetical protein